MGFAEHDGAAVVCHNCKGTGKVHVVHTYEDFEGRKSRKGIKRVYRVNPGIGVGAGHGHTLEEFGGMPYDDWAANKKFPKGSEMRKYTCPCWYYQSADYDKAPAWRDGEVQCQIRGSFSGCKHFPEKEKCWARWDKEQEKS